jgi:O-antigen ligase
MYVAMALVYFSWLVIHSPRALFRWLYLLGGVILLAGLLQLASRAVFMAVLLIFNIILPYFMLKGGARKKFIFVSLSLTVLSLLAVTGNKNFRSRYIDQLGKDLQRNPGGPDIPEPRMARWLCAWELIRQSPLVGYGTGVETRLLKEKYQEHHLYDSYDKELNAHNQYLSFWLKTGLLGLLLYLYILGVGCWQAFRRRDPFFMGFIVLVAIVSLSENILDMNKGIFFFGFFFSFLLLRRELPTFAPQFGNKNIMPLVGAVSPH